MKKILFLTLAALLLSACSAEGRKRGGNATIPDSVSTVSVAKPIVSTVPVAKPIVNVYIENSGSMDGYVKGVTEFEQAIYSYLIDIKISGIANTLNLFYINSKIIPQGSNISDFIEKLEPDTFKEKGGNRGTSDISNVLETVLSKTGKNNVAILVTDGIFSPGKGKNAKEYLGSQATSIKNAMSTYLKNYPHTAVVVYQLISKFDGNYYNRDNLSTKINVSRPYYIWVIGDVANIALLKTNIPDTKFKGGGVQHSYTLLPAISKEIDYAILSNPKFGNFKRDKGSPKTSIFDIEKAQNGVHKGEFMFTIGMDLSFFSALLGNDYLMNTESYVRLINKQPNNDYDYEMEPNTSPNTNYTHNMKLSTKKIVVGELEIALRDHLPQWVEEMNDDEGLNINTNNAINKTFGIKYLVGGIYEAYNFSGNTIYTTMKFNLKK
jgi:hypothetical protein